MDIGVLLRPGFPGNLLWSPLAFSALLALAVGFVWTALAPARPARALQQRMDGYLERADAVALDPTAAPFGSRAILPIFRKLLHVLGALAPRRNVEATQRLLVQAGEPGRLSAVDFFGLRVLVAVLLAALYFRQAGGALEFGIAARNSLLLAVGGFFLPWLLLRSRANRRRHAIKRALPDALDMLTIGVEAGLAFESALVRVGEKWQNPLTQEFRRAVAEMRVGAPRDAALQRMADRCGVEELNVFVSVLVQSSQLGVSIAQVLHTQAAQMRLKRRQHAEELARQASVKMVFPLVFFIMPALFVVILGPAVPSVLEALGLLTGQAASMGR